jgi:hypothetical protein
MTCVVLLIAVSALAIGYLAQRARVNRLEQQLGRVTSQVDKLWSDSGNDWPDVY